MVFQDKAIVCAECGESFDFSADDQNYHSEKGYSDPKRCPSCRQARRSQRSTGGFGGGDYGERQMYSVTCADCGKDAEVPFQPSGDRPVYCNDCFRNHREQRTY